TTQTRPGVPGGGACPMRIRLPEPGRRGRSLARLAGYGSLVLAAAALAVPALTTAARAPVTARAVSAAGTAPQGHGSGNELVDASGNQVVLHGMNRSGTEYACVQGNGIFDGPSDQASITAMLSWTHVNAVRVPLNEACWNGESYVNPADAGASYQQ